MTQDPRELRRQRMEAEKRQELPKTLLKKYALPVLVVIALVGGVYALTQAADEAQGDCPGHWHATFGLFIEDDRVPFPQPPYDMESQRLPLSMHMHRGNMEQLHFEPSPSRCRGVESTMSLLDVDIDPGRLSLGGAHEQGAYGGTYTDSGNMTVRVFTETAKDGLKEWKIADILDYQLQDGQKMIIVYGNYDDETIQSMMDGVSWAPGFDPNHTLA